MGVLLTASDADWKPLKGAGIQGTFNVYVLTCGNCGFVRLHNIAELDEPVPEDEAH
jgi:hypothetical protein